MTVLIIAARPVEYCVAARVGGRAETKLAHA